MMWVELSRIVDGTFKDMIGCFVISMNALAVSWPMTWVNEELSGLALVRIAMECLVVNSYLVTCVLAN